MSHLINIKTFNVNMYEQNNYHQCLYQTAILITLKQKIETFAVGSLNNAEERPRNFNSFKLKKKYM